MSTNPFLSWQYVRLLQKVVLFWLLSSISLGLSAATSPENIEGTTRINAEEFIEIMNQTTGMVVIDSRIPGDRKQGYVEGSISLPDEQTTCASLKEKIPSKTTPALFYCNGVKCGRSANAIKIAKTCGYSKLYWFRGGFEEWLAKGYPYIQE